MNTSEYVIEKYKPVAVASPIMEIPNVGRDDLAVLIHDLDFKIGVEVGVASGQYSKVLNDCNPQMKLYGIDPWASYKEYKDYVKKETFDYLETEAMKRLSDRPNYEFIKDFSMNAIKRFEDNSIDFVYIDANHEDPYITQDIEGWFKKVRSGGIVSGHDFTKPKHASYNVISAVMNFVKNNNISPLFIWGLNGKANGLKRDSARSWMIIKP